jgi:large subunit ribosomal protein L32e
MEVAEKAQKRTLIVRLRKKLKKPKFKRQQGGRFKKLKETWRRPRGRHSKLRLERGGKGKKPSVGYGSPRGTKGLTRSGYKPVLVSNMSELKRIDPVKEAAVLRSGVGKKKRAEIISEAEKLNIRTLNAYKYKLRDSE